MSRRAYIYRKKIILFFLGIFSWMWTSKFGYYWIFLCNRISRNFVVYKDRMCNLYITDDPIPLFFVILFIVCQRNVNSSKTTEYNFLRQLHVCASKHLYGKFKFRYFHVNFAFGIVEYVYNIDSFSTKQLNNFVVNTYTCNTRWHGVCKLLQFFLSFFSGKQE